MTIDRSVRREGSAAAPSRRRTGGRLAALAAVGSVLLSCGRIDITVPGGDGGRDGDGERPGVAWVAAAAGGSHSCALSASGTVYCWGSDERGQLGLGGDIPGGGSGGCSGPCSLRPRAVASGAALDTVVSGAGHTCGLTPRGAAVCWGANDRGQLGDSTRTDRPVPTPVAGGLAFRSLSAGGRHTCGITRTRRHLYCWGDDFWGQIGRRGRSTAAVTGPRFVLRDARAVSAGTDHTCALVGPDRLLYCWGRNHRGQLGLGYASERPETLPTLVFVGARSVAAGRWHTCALSAAGSAAICWGWNDEGAVGTGRESGFEPNPRRVTGGGTYRLLDAGGGHSCGVTGNGALRCWGDDLRGQLGLGNGGGFRPAPAAVAQGRSLRSVSTGTGAVVETAAPPASDLDGRRLAAHTCAVDGDAELLCWGDNSHGQLGDGTRTPRSRPVRVATPGGP